MEESILYDLLGKSVIHDWREVAEKDKIKCFDEQEKKSEAELLKELPERYKDTLRSYSLAIEERMDYLHYNLRVKILNLGVKVGLQLQEAFIEFDKE